MHIPAEDQSFQLVIANEGEDQAGDVAKRRDVLAKLKLHPRDTEANRAALARADRCWQDALGETRDMIEQWIVEFQAALATQDPRRADRAREALLEALDRFEGATFL